MTYFTLLSIHFLHIGNRSRLYYWQNHFILSRSPSGSTQISLNTILSTDTLLSPRCTFQLATLNNTNIDKYRINGEFKPYIGDSNHRAVAL